MARGKDVQKEKVMHVEKVGSRVIQCEIPGENARYFGLVRSGSLVFRKKLVYECLWFDSLDWLEKVVKW